MSLSRIGALSIRLVCGSSCLKFVLRLFFWVVVPPSILTFPRHPLDLFISLFSPCFFSCCPVLRALVACLFSWLSVSHSLASCEVCVASFGLRPSHISFFSCRVVLAVVVEPAPCTAVFVVPAVSIKRYWVRLSVCPSVTQRGKALHGSCRCPLSPPFVFRVSVIRAHHLSGGITPPPEALRVRAAFPSTATSAAFLFIHTHTYIYI